MGGILKMAMRFAHRRLGIADWATGCMAEYVEGRQQIKMKMKTPRNKVVVGRFLIFFCFWPIAA